MERVIEGYLYPYFKILDNIPYQHNTLHFLVAIFIAVILGSVGIFGFTILERDICENIKNEHSRSFITKASKMVYSSFEVFNYIINFVGFFRLFLYFYLARIVQVK